MMHLLQRKENQVAEANSQLRDRLHKFNKAKKEKPKFTFWKQYMELVQLLLHLYMLRIRGN